MLLLTLILGILPNSLTILTISGIILSLNIKFENLFKKAWIFYSLAFILAVVAAYFYKEAAAQYVVGGFIGYGFMILVMYAGVLPNKSYLGRLLKKNRGVYSILSFLMISPHALLHVLGVIGVVNLYGLVAYVIMVPLTFVSFRVIRKEIDPKDWIRIQKAAYIVYFALFIHLLVVAGNFDKIIYAVLLTLYANNKVLKEIKRWDYLRS